MQRIKSIRLIVIFALSLTLLSFDSNETTKIFKECTLSATGTVESAEFGTIVVTIKVTGPCDKSLSRELIAEIARFRAEAAS